MLRSTVAVCIIAGMAGAQAPVGKAPAWLQGRWTTTNMPVAYNFVGDSVEVMIIPLQGPFLTYRLNGKTIEVTAGGNNAPPADMAIRKDTLILTQGGNDTRYLRVGVEPWDSTSLQGTWRRNEDGLATVLTFRSDGVLIRESGRMSDPNFHGDTLEVSFGTGRTMRYIFRQKKDTLYMRAVIGGPEQEYVRRPWGCFGMAPVNGKAKECR